MVIFHAIHERNIKNIYIQCEFVSPHNYVLSEWLAVNPNHEPKRILLVVFINQQLCGMTLKHYALLNVYRMLYNKVNITYICLDDERINQ